MEVDNSQSYIDSFEIQPQKIQTVPETPDQKPEPC